MMTTVDSQSEQMAVRASEFSGFRNFALRGVKEKVGDILDTIGRVDGIFATYTRHDLTHVNQMLEILEWLVPPTTHEAMTPVDWLMVTLAVYFHDLGMAVTHQEYAERESNDLFRNFVKETEEDPSAADFRDRLEKIGSADDDATQHFLYQEFVRENHALRIRQWITGRVDRRWGNSVRDLANAIAKIMEDVPPRFREHLGLVCESHHKDDLDDLARKIHEELAGADQAVEIV